MRYITLASILLTTTSLSVRTMAQDAPDSVLRPTKQFSKSVVKSGLAGPWELTWGPDNMLWVTERTGKRVTRVNPTTGESAVAITIDEVSVPGGQDGLLGMALHPGLLKGMGSDFVYVFYSYIDKARGAHSYVPAPNDPYRYLYGKILRLTYNPANATLSSPVTIIDGLPAGNDHVGGRLKFGPDRKLYLTLGDHGNNQLGNYCLAIEAQRIPSRTEIDSKNYAAYAGKILRIDLDGTVPKDNPEIEGVISHVLTYGHRNPQGLDFAPDSTIYSSEQGPKTDDEVNILKRGGNYGWPNVAGLRDNKAYEYARWAEATTPCSQLRFSDLAIHPSVPRESESAYTKPFIEPLATMFTVPSTFNFHNPACKGIDFICWATVAASSIEHYQSKGTGIPGWDRVLLVTTLKRGSLYVLPLTPDGQAKAGYFTRYFQSENRYRDTAVSPDGRTIYIATDPSGLAESLNGGTTTKMQDKGSILAFTYIGEGPDVPSVAAPSLSQTSPAASTGNTPTITATITPTITATIGISPQFTAAQALAGKTAYNANCAVCHGSTMTNGTFGTPLAGEYFKTTWSGKSVQAFYDRAQKTMPPAAPGSLSKESYANILAFILETNGFKAGDKALPAGGEALDKMTIR